MDRLTFPPAQPTPGSRRLNWVVGLAVALCVGSLVTLTLLIPTPSSIPKGGLVPIAPAAAVR